MIQNNKKLWMILCAVCLCFVLLVKANQRQGIKKLKLGNSKLQSNEKQGVQQKASNSKMDNFELSQRISVSLDKLKLDQTNDIINSLDQLEFDHRLGRKKNLEQAIGIVLSFHKWPSEKVQARLSQQLKTEGLTLTKQFKSFKALVFSWKTLQTQKKAESVCLKLSNLKNLNYCEPDALLHPNNKAIHKESETEAGAISCTVDCDQTPYNLSILQNTLKELTPEPCEPLSSKQKLKDGKLTDYWAQEMVGADLLREEIEKAPPLPEDKFLVAVFDTTSDDHNIHVQNLISHEGEQAVLPELNASQMQFFHTNIPSTYMSVVENLTQDLNTKQNTQQSSMDSSVQVVTETLLSKQRLPSFINNSMDWNFGTQTRSIYEAMSRVHPPAVLIQSSGNNYSQSLGAGTVKDQFSKDFDSILVGSLSPRGLVSDFSEEGEEVHILAPSDNWITSVDGDGQYKKFRGTSGAAPLVTGSLAGFEWLSGYHPTAREAKLLLEQTAIPTIHSVFENPQRNGVGMLNAYKLGRVAKRLKEKCHTDLDCFQREIKNKANYKFSIDAEDILESVNSSFPKCSDQDETQVSCEDKKSAFKKLRQAILLDLENVDLLEKMHCIYTQEGFLENAFNIKTTMVALTKDEDRALRHLEQFLQTSPEAIIKPLNLIARDIGGKKGAELLKKTLAQNSDRSVKRAIASRAIREIGGEEGLEIWKIAAQDFDLDVREEVSKEARKIGGEEGSKILQILDQSNLIYRYRDVDTDDPTVKEAIIEAIGVGGQGGLQTLRLFAQSPDPYIRKIVVRAARDIGGEKGVNIIRFLTQDSNKQVREEAIKTLQSIEAGVN